MNRDKMVFGVKPLWQRAAEKAIEKGIVSLDLSQAVSKDELLALREKLSYNQAHLAGILEVSQAQVCLWEKGLPAPGWVIAAVRGFMADLVELVPQEKKVSTRQLKDSLKEKAGEVGHQCLRWRTDGRGGWWTSCVCEIPDPNMVAAGVRPQNWIFYPCGFTVKINKDKKIEPNRPWEQCQGTPQKNTLP